MTIFDAMLDRSTGKPCITRRAWSFPTTKPLVAAVKLLPTDGPDGCIILSSARKDPCTGWTPSARDLIVDDWITVSL